LTLSIFICPPAPFAVDVTDDAGLDHPIEVTRSHYANFSVLDQITPFSRRPVSIRCCR
jgi:hypothetical protein